MLHIILRINNKIPQHLHALSMLKMDMLLITHRIREVLMNQLPDDTPSLTVL